MARKQQPAGGERVGHAYGTNLFARLDLAKTQQLIRQLFPVVEHSGKVRTTHASGAGTFWTNCVIPGHEDDTPSLLVDCRKGYAKCRGAGCGFYTTNLLALLQHARGWSLKEAATQVHTVTGVRVVTERSVKLLEARDVHQQATAALFRVCNEHLGRCLHPPTTGRYAGDYSPAFLRVVQPTLDWLYHARGHKPEYAAQLPYGVLPSLELVRRFVGDYLDDLMVAQAKQGRVAMTRDVRAKVFERVEAILRPVDVSWTHCVTWHTGYAPTVPGRLRLRRPRDDKQGGTETCPGLDEDDPVGFYGLWQARHAAFGATELASQFVLPVEGENDATSYLEGLLAAGKTGVLPLATIGTHNRLDDLASAGVTRVHLFSDEPDPEHGKGDKWVKHLLGESSALDVRVFDGWDALKAGLPKDPDEAIRTHGFDAVYDLTAGPHGRFVTAEAWAFDRATAAALDGDVRERLRWALEYGGCVRQPTAQGVYVDMVAKALDVPVGTLRQELLKSDSTEAGYVARLAATLLHEFHRSYREDGQKGGTLHLFHKRTGRAVSFFMTDGRSMMAQLASIFGDMWTWFQNNVGLPPVFADEFVEDIPGRVKLLPEKLKDLTGYLELAMHTVYQGVPSRTECVELGQGVWYFAELGVVYVVNGARVYKGTWSGSEACTLAWEELTGPSDGQFLFLTTSTGGWSTEIQGVEDLTAGNAYTKADLQQVCEDVVRLLDTVWRFRHQRLDARYLGYLVGAYAATAAFPTKTSVHVLGDTNTGKSSLMSIFGGMHAPDLRLVEAARYSPTYSASWVIQTWNHLSLACLLDEFEAEGGTHKGQQVEAVSEVFRQITTEGGANPGRGTQDGRPRNFALHADVMTASILRAALPQDANRRVPIELALHVGGKPPPLAVRDLLTATRYAEMRRMLTLGFLKYLPELRRAAAELKLDVAQTPRVDYAVPSRFSDNLVPAAAVMRLLGAPWSEFLTETFEARRESLRAVARDTASSALYERLISTGGLCGSGGARRTITSLLAKADEAMNVSTAGWGVVYDESRMLLAVDWWAASSVGGLLHRADGYEHTRPSNLKHSFDQHPKALTARQLTEGGVLKLLRSYGYGSDDQAVSAIDVRELVTKLRGVAQLRLVAPPEDVPPVKAVEKEGNI